MMIKFLIGVSLFFGVCVAKGQQPFQLAPPLVSYSSLIFNNQTTVSMRFAQPGTNIHYTTNGKEPTTKSSRYQQAILIAGQRAHLKAKVFGKGFLPSATVSLEFIRQGLPIAAISGTLPDKKYTANGLASLHDEQGGLPDINNGQWLGYTGDTVSWTITFAKMEKPKQLLLHCLQQPGSWIFLPQQIQVYAWHIRSSSYRLAAQWHAPKATADLPTSIAPINITLNNVPNTTLLKVVCYPLAQLPAWHAGAGQPAWLFTDEIIVY
jgi:hypothetical protein